MNNLTLVIPAKYEVSTLPIVLQEIKDMQLSCKIIVVVPEYDKSTIEAIAKFDCKILIQKGEGFGNALIQGLNESNTKYSCIFNADGSFDPKYLLEMSEKLDQGIDFIFNTRYIRPGGSDDDTIITIQAIQPSVGLSNCAIKSMTNHEPIKIRMINEIQMKMKST